MVEESNYSVMTMNIRFGLADDGVNAWQNRKSLFEKLFKRYSTTFMGIQEANHFQTDFLAKTLCDHHFIGLYNPSKELWQSNLVFYHKTWKCLKSRHYFLSSTPDKESKMQDSKWPRQCVIGLFKKKSREIIVATTHFDFIESVQKKSASLVLRFLDDFPKDCPIIITGDFNSNPDDKAYHVFMANGFAEAFDKQHSTTFHEFAGNATMDHIDWILFRGNTKLLEKKIIMDSFAGHYPSDHYPVIATFL
jgi:endonuclease/exonuclease/phosphatase family metal-dependent hydrolase